MHTYILASETCRRLHSNIVIITIHPTSVIMKSIHPITNHASRPDDDEVHVVTVDIGANNRAFYTNMYMLKLKRTYLLLLTMALLMEKIL